MKQSTRTKKQSIKHKYEPPSGTFFESIQSLRSPPVACPQIFHLSLSRSFIAPTLLPQKKKTLLLLTTTKFFFSVFLLFFSEKKERKKETLFFKAEEHG